MLQSLANNSSVLKYDKEHMIFLLPYSEKYRVARVNENVFIIYGQIATHHKIAKTVDIYKAYWYAFKRSNKHILRILYEELKKRSN
jgi:hypothetical protein